MSASFAFERFLALLWIRAVPHLHDRVRAAPVAAGGDRRDVCQLGRNGGRDPAQRE